MTVPVKSATGNTSAWMPAHISPCSHSHATTSTQYTYARSHMCQLTAVTMLSAFAAFAAAPVANALPRAQAVEK